MLHNQKLKGFIIAIDGPAGAGKSTVSRLLAEALGGCLLDTGAMYRGIAYRVIKTGGEVEKEIAKVARTTQFDMAPGSHELLVDGENLGQKLRTQRVSEMASVVSALKGVRATLTKRQRELGKKISKQCPVVVEGRDIGTVVFPDVEFKFFVTADPKVRATRRFHQLRNHGVKGVTLSKILKENQKRDDRDSNRKHSPLRCPKNAVVVDTSSLSINQVVHFMVDHIRNRVSLGRNRGKIG